MKEMEEWKFFNIKVWILLFLISFLLIYKQACSKVSGHCSDCHTMHYSQSGQVLATWGKGGPFKALLIGDCVFCHTGTNDGTNKTPYVYSKSEPTYTFGGNRNTLAGGNFYWVTSNNNYGHNVAGIANSDTLSEPPGWDSSYGRNITSWSGQQITCAGKYGCHGDPDKSDPVEAILGAHHNNINCNATDPNNNCTGTEVWNSYRFLLGIKGTEDPNWELTLSKDDHNGYYAIDNPTGGTSNEGSINYLCGECHGKFHSDTGSGSSPWLRHPTDYDMNHVSSKEYGDYPNISVFNNTLGVSATGDYFADVPVGTEDGSIVSNVWNEGKGAIVLCVSCHRAHATPYDDILRWNYRGWPNGNDTQNGCLACHTTKY